MGAATFVLGLAGAGPHWDDARVYEFHLQSAFMDLVKEFWTWWNWIWSEAGGAWVAAILAGGAVFYAKKSWEASRKSDQRSWDAHRETIQSSFRPVLRPVKVSSNGGSWFLVLKNYGNGPAISAMVFNAFQGGESDDPKSTTGNNVILGQADVVEPLGPRDGGTKEWQRAGRRVLKLARYLQDGRDYRVIYQDLDGAFHETAFRYGTKAFSQIRYMGQRKSADVPAVARERAHVVTA